MARAKKALPQRQPEDPASPLASWQPLVAPPRPIDLPKADSESDKPLFVFIDDDAEFLRQLRGLWQANYATGSRLQTINSKEQDLKNWLEQLFSTLENSSAEAPSVLFIDRNMPVGLSGAELLERLNGEECTRYIPTVLVSTSNDSSLSHNTTPMAQQARLSLVDKAANVYFLNEAINAYYYSQALSQDAIWIDLIKQTNYASAEQQADIKVVINDSLGFLQRRLHLSRVYLRHLDNDMLSCLFPPDVEPKLQQLDPKAIPLLQQLLDSEQPATQLVHELSRDQVGKLRPEFEGYRLLAAALIYKQRRSGVLVLLRTPDQAQFRDKDEFFISQLAAVLGAYLGGRSEEQELRQRQTSLLEFLAAVGEQVGEEAVCQLLGDFLHKQVNENSSLAKTSVRRLDYFSGKLERIYLEPPSSSIAQEVSIATKNSAYAWAVREHEPVLIKNTDASSPDSNFYLKTTEGMRSALVVPLASEGVCLGAANMEHPGVGYYSESEREFAAALARAATQVLLLRRARDFQLGLLQLTGELFSAQPEQLLRSCFYLLYRFSCCAALLHFSPPADEIDSPWRVQSYAYVGDTVKPDAAASASWQSYVSVSWQQSYAYRCMKDFYANPEGKLLAYSTNRNEILDDASIEISGVKMDTQSEALLYISDGNNRLLAMIVLLYRLPNALSEAQRQQLELFVNFLGPLLSGQARVRWLQERRALDQRLALLGRAYSQLRHVMINKLSATVGMLDPRVTLDIDDKEQLRRELRELETEVENVGVLIRPPKTQPVDLQSLWAWLESQFQLRAQELGLRLSAEIKVKHWHSDKDIVRHVVYNLVDNALQAFARWPERVATSGLISLSVYERQDGLCLRLSDNGPGVADSVRAKLFDIGVSNKGSAGFGLHFARARARDLGGDLVYDAQHSPGAAFELLLPHKVDTEIDND